MPKKIILCSDGTGNAGGPGIASNVWRLYTALDISAGDQVAAHDDGVGSQDHKIGRALGGAFGWGLTRNVKQLYEFLCRNYCDGDHIYLFGFSRGAYTARVLGGLICTVGVLDANHRDYGTAAKLSEGVDRAYRMNRRRYRTVFQSEPSSSEISLLKPDSVLHPDIAFIGVWDTVDAVGLPIDELADILDKYIYKFRFSDGVLSSRVERACHAISIDDERHTFHPVNLDTVFAFSHDFSAGRIA